MLPDGSQHHPHDLLWDRFPGLDLCHTDPEQHSTPAAWDLDDLYVDDDLSDLSDLSVRRAN